MKKIISILMCALFVSCGNTVQNKDYTAVEDSIVYEVDSTVVDDSYADDYINNGNTYVEATRSTFRPVSATISDSEGTFTSSDFDCPNMIVYDEGNSVQLSWGGETIPLNEAGSPDTYVASQTKSGTTMKFVGYRSSSSGRIYLVICTTIDTERTVEINFKP